MFTIIRPKTFSAEYKVVLLKKKVHRFSYMLILIKLRTENVNLLTNFIEVGWLNNKM